MDFLNIILEGYMDRDKREFFSDYIYQRFKEAEKEKFYKAEQFYKGLLNAVQDLKDILEAQFYERKKELLLLMELNKNSDKPGKEKEKRSASYSEELENLSVSHFSVNLTRLTSHRFTGALWQKDIDFIEDSIRLNLARLHISEIKELLPKLAENTNKGATTPDGKHVKQITAKMWAVTYVLDCQANNWERIRNEKIRLEEFIAKHYQSMKVNPNTVYKNLNLLTLTDEPPETKLIELLGNDWRSIVLTLSHNKKALEEYLKVTY